MAKLTSPCREGRRRHPDPAPRALPRGRAGVDRPAGPRRGSRGARGRRRARRGDARGRRAPRRALPRPRRAARPERRAQHRPGGHRRAARVLRRRRRRGAPGLARRAAGAPRRPAPTRSPSSPARSTPASRTTASAPAGARGRPITFLDLGAADRDCDHAWGANMAVRRSAVERAGRFDEARELYGDEQEWQARVKAAGGRIRYVAGRRARPPPRGRRRAPARAVPRRLPPRAGQPALRRLQGHGAVAGAPSCACSPAALLHGPRRACMNGPVLDRALARAPARRAGGARPPPATRRGLPLGHQRHGRRQARRAAARPRRAGSTCARRRGARACAAPRAASRRAGACSRVGIERPGSLMAAARAELRAQPPRGRRRHRAAGRARQVREPQRAARRPSARGLRLAARDRRRRRAAARLPRRASCAPPSAPA